MALTHASAMSNRGVFHLDYTHIGRRASGIERITTELFNSEALAPLDIRPYAASGGRLHVIAAQMVGLPICAVRNPSDIFIFPGFPPSPYFAFARARSVLYVHDLFLLTRRGDLNRAGKYYMAPLFSIAVKKFSHFLTNSEETAKNLRVRCDPAASIVPYRPGIRNVFGVAVGDRPGRASNSSKLRVLSIGTIEPRKNFLYAAAVCDALSDQLKRPVELHIVGRYGWGDDARQLSNRRNVVLHGYLDDPEVRNVIGASDILLCTSHQEGLGLPLLEVQYSGLPVVAPDDAVFRECLGVSGIFIDLGSPRLAAERIAAAVSMPSWREQYAAKSLANLDRWNEIANGDRRNVISFLAALASRYQP